MEILALTHTDNRDKRNYQLYKQQQGHHNYDKCFTGFIQKQISVLHHCNINMDTLGQPFGLDVGSNQEKKSLC
ncbi:MAG: hypothetical protein KBA43_06540 [Paludibacteraceae bacterium]|nr:hypothetical protein [Paludibacteraceae bacterium]